MPSLKGHLLWPLLQFAPGLWRWDTLDLPESTFSCPRIQRPDSSPFCVSLVSHLGLIAGPSSAPPRLPPCLEVFLAFFCILPAVYNSTARTHNWVSWPSRAPWDGVTLFQHGPRSLTVCCGLDMVTTTELQGAAIFIYGTKGSVDQHERVWACHLMALTALLCTLWHPLYAPQPGGSL